MRRIQCNGAPTSPRPTREVMGPPGGVVQCMAGALRGVAPNGGPGVASAGAPDLSGPRSGAGAAEPAPTAEDLTAIRGYAANPRHPLYEWSRKLLAKLGLE